MSCSTSSSTNLLLVVDGTITRYSLSCGLLTHYFRSRINRASSSLSFAYGSSPATSQVVDLEDQAGAYTHGQVDHSGSFGGWIVDTLSLSRSDYCRLVGVEVEQLNVLRRRDQLPAVPNL